MFDRISVWFWQTLANWFRQDPADCDHDWHVVATVLATVELQVQCFRCGLWGTVPRPTKEEWTKAFNAPEDPYRWNDQARVQFDASDSEQRS